MRNVRATLGAAALIVLAIVLVPLQLTFFDVCASGAKTPAERARLGHESEVLQLTCLCVASVAAWMVHSVSPKKIRPYAGELVSLVWIVCSLICGFFVWQLNWPDWYQVVYRTIR